MKPSDGGVVNGGECANKQKMEDKIIKLLSTQEKDKLKETYKKGSDSAQVWTGQNGSNSMSFNDIQAIVKGLTLRGNVINAYAEMLMYKQQIKAPKSTDEEKS
ncbi:hypothetical protein CsSME_00012278 [Camellia sinensis var. sinensis]